MLNALQTQLTAGPLADLDAGTVDGNGFVTSVQGLVSSYSANVDQQLLPRFPSIDQLLKLQGQRIVADVVALNQLSTVGLMTPAEAAAQVPAAIRSLTAGPITRSARRSAAYIERRRGFS